MTRHDFKRPKADKKAKKAKEIEAVPAPKPQKPKPPAPPPPAAERVATPKKSFEYYPSPLGELAVSGKPKDVHPIEYLVERDVSAVALGDLLNQHAKEGWVMRDIVVMPLNGLYTLIMEK